MENESDEEVSFNPHRYTAPITMEVPPRSSPSSLSGLDLNEDEGEEQNRRDSASGVSGLSPSSESDDDAEGMIPPPHEKTVWVGICSSRLRQQYLRTVATKVQESLEAPSLPPETPVTSDWLCERLEALGRNPQAVEVGLDPSGNVYLQDGRGAFLYVARREKDGARSPSLTARVLPRTPEEVDALRETVRALKKEIGQLESRFRDDVKVAEARSAKELARLKKENARLRSRCDELQLRRCEENLPNEAEVDVLRRRLQQLESPPTRSGGGVHLVRKPTSTSATPRRQENGTVPKRKSEDVAVKEESPATFDRASPPTGSGGGATLVRTPTSTSASTGRKENGIVPKRRSESVAAKEESPATFVKTSPTCQSPAQRGPEVSRKRGKALPIEYFSAEDPEILLDDWLPTVESAVEWNGWTKAENVMQLEGHLQWKALQEWMMMSKKEQSVMKKNARKCRKRRKLDMDGRRGESRKFFDPCRWRGRRPFTRTSTQRYGLRPRENLRVPLRSRTSSS